MSIERSFADAAPAYEYIESPACPLSEYYYMRWLISLYGNGLTPDLYNGLVSYNAGRKSSNATYIKKDYKSSSETKLVLRADHKVLEGMIVHDETTEVIRPICAFAHYDRILPEKHAKIHQELRGFNLGTTSDTLSIILGLLSGMNIGVGSDFETNIRAYSELMERRGSIEKYWGTLWPKK